MMTRIFDQDSFLLTQHSGNIDATINYGVDCQLLQEFIISGLHHFRTPSFQDFIISGLHHFRTPSFQDSIITAKITMKLGSNVSFVINRWKTDFQGQINPSTNREWTPARFCKEGHSDGISYKTLIEYIGKRNKEHKGYGNLLTPDQIQDFVALMQEQGIDIDSPKLIRAALQTTFRLSKRQAYHQYTTVIKKVMGSNEEDQDSDRTTACVPKNVQKKTQKKTTNNISSIKAASYDSSFGSEFNYLYFQCCGDLKQRLITSDGCKAGHPLLSYQTRAVKNLHNSITGALDYVQLQVNLELSENMLYISPDLSAKAHGDHPTSDKQRVDEIISKANISIIDIPRSVHVKHLSAMGFHLYRAGHAPATSKFLNTFRS